MFEHSVLRAVGIVGSAGLRPDGHCLQPCWETPAGSLRVQPFEELLFAVGDSAGRNRVRGEMNLGTADAPVADGDRSRARIVVFLRPAVRREDVAAGRDRELKVTGPFNVH